MLKQEQYTDDEYTSMFLFAARQDNTQAMAEVRDHNTYFGKRVKVVKGRKCPIGTVGEVFYLCRKHYGTNQWFGFLTCVGIRTDDGAKVWTSTDNIELCK